MLQTFRALYSHQCCFDVPVVTRIQLSGSWEALATGREMNWIYSAMLYRVEPSNGIGTCYESVCTTSGYIAVYPSSTRYFYAYFRSAFNDLLESPTDWRAALLRSNAMKNEWQSSFGYRTLSLSLSLSLSPPTDRYNENPLNQLGCVRARI